MPKLTTKKYYDVASAWQLVHNGIKNQLGNLWAYVKTNLKDILPEFQDFLHKRNLVPEKSIPYHALWASRFIRFANGRPDRGRETLLLEFLEEARSRWTLADWQVSRVHEAANLYIHHFQGAVIETIGNGEPRKMPDPGTVLSEAKRLLRLKHYSYRTEQTYLDWVRRFIKYIGDVKKNIGGPIPKDVKDFLSHLALVQKVSSSTQNQAFNALLFLFRDVLGQNMGDLSGTVRAKRGVRLPVVLSVEEVKQLLSGLSRRNLLIAQLLYGAGLRLMECARLRIKDIDFEANSIFVRAGKGDNDRTTIFTAFGQQAQTEQGAQMRRTEQSFWPFPVAPCSRLGGTHLLKLSHEKDENIIV